MPLSTFLRLAIDLTDILGRIHAANVIHKDINPGNIVLNLDTGVVKIIDFGIATQFNRTNPTFKSLLFTGFVALSFAHAPTLIQGLMLCYATETLIVAIISYWWKITIHTASMACSLVALTYPFGAIVLPFYLLLLLVSQARIVLKRHTITQAIAGALLGIVLTAIQLLSFFPRLSYILTG